MCSVLDSERHAALMDIVPALVNFAALPTRLMSICLNPCCERETTGIAFAPPSIETESPTP